MSVAKQTSSEKIWSVLENFLSSVNTEDLFLQLTNNYLATTEWMRQTSASVIKKLKSKLPTLKEILQAFALSEKLALVTDLMQLAQSQANAAFSAFWDAVQSHCIDPVHKLTRAVKEAACKILLDHIIAHYFTSIKSTLDNTDDPLRQPQQHMFL
eukprot:TRINITY_DN112650_c0_g1_i1.p1 TRINITY_DN112650_c0_g1~~TRINITY_DN112650_c0_g1_i1.p1  ORF type:complete len:155 (+),score=6.29 TRINITY_DN112650_c0_g1_i1:61-525(+)